MKHQCRRCAERFATQRQLLAHRKAKHPRPDPWRFSMKAWRRQFTSPGPNGKYAKRNAS